MLYLICFDISNDKTRNRVGKYLETFGNRVQKSVFEVEIKDLQTLNHLQNKLGSWLDKNDDLKFYCLCRNCRLKSYNAKGERIAKQPSLVII